MKFWHKTPFRLTNLLGKICLTLILFVCAISFHQVTPRSLPPQQYNGAIEHGVLLELKVCCVINDKSGSAIQTHQQAIAELFAQQNVEVKFYKIADYESVKDLVNNAMREGFDIVVAGGGDGTVNAVASALIEHPSARLGV